MGTLLVALVSFGWVLYTAESVWDNVVMAGRIWYWPETRRWPHVAGAFLGTGLLSFALVTGFRHCL